MQQHDHHISAAPLGLCHRTAHRRHDIGYRQPRLAQIVGVPHHRPRRGGANDGNAHRAHARLRTFHHGPRRHECATGGFVHIGGEKRKPGLCDGTPEQRHAIVELMIAQHRCVVPHHVHRGDDRMHGWLTDFRRHEGERIALQQVAPVDQEHTPGIGTPDGVYDGRRTRQRVRGIGGIGVVVPRAEAPMHIRGGGDHEIEARGALTGSRQCADGTQQRQDAPRPAHTGTGSGRRIAGSFHGRMLADALPRL